MREAPTATAGTVQKEGPEVHTIMYFVPYSTAQLQSDEGCNTTRFNRRIVTVWSTVPYSVKVLLYVFFHCFTVRAGAAKVFHHLSTPADRKWEQEQEQEP